jgi:hypothetical protein
MFCFVMSVVPKIDGTKISVAFITAVASINDEFDGEKSRVRDTHFWMDRPKPRVLIWISVFDNNRLLEETTFVRNSPVAM